MNTEQDIICRLCLKGSDKGFLLIDETVKLGLGVLSVNMNFDLSYDPLMCEDCAEIVKKSLSFILACLEAEKMIALFDTREDTVSIDLRDVYAHKSKEIVSPDSFICRFCMMKVEEEGCIPLNVLMKENAFIDAVKGCMSMMQNFVVEESEDDFSQLNEKKCDNEHSENSVADVVIYKKKKLEENQNKRTTEQFKSDRKKVLAKLRKIKYLEKQKNIPKDKISDSSIEHSKELSRQRSQRYRNKKRLELLNCADVTVQRQSAVSEINVQSNVQNQSRIHDSQIAGPSWLNVPFVQNNDAGVCTAEPHISTNRDSSSDSDSNTHNIDNLRTTKQQDDNSNLESSGDNILQEDYLSEIHTTKVVSGHTSNQQSHHSHPRQQYTSYNIHSSAHLEFKKKFFDNDFGHPCNICDRLWFKGDLHVFKNNDVTNNIQFIRTLLTNCDIPEVKMCKTCLQSIKKNKIPTLSVHNGFKYPPFPDNLKHVPLNLVSERLISPRVPFMQIRRLRQVYGQYGIYGQVINVPIEVNTMVNRLPRNVDDDHAITVNIKGKKIHKPSYVYGKVNKNILKKWLKFLIKTPLYEVYNVTIDEHFFGENDSIDNEAVEEVNEQFEDILIEESLVAQQQTLLWNEDMCLRIENNLPISIFDEHAEELSFPAIYLGQFRIFKEGVSVTPLMMATSEVRRADRRGVTPHHLLYMAMKIMRIRVRDALPIAFKHVGEDTGITEEQIQDENYVHGCVESNLAFLRSIPNSTWYWQERKKDLFAMIRQLGKPTIFFTISANEMGWPNLLQLLYKLKHNEDISIENAENLHYMIKSTLINEDAVTCALYFNKLVNVILYILQSKKFSPFKKYRVLHYFKRIEFQHRGSQRAHVLAWLDNAPKNAVEEDYNKAIELIDSLISISDAEASGNTKLQTHKHTSTCYKKITSNKAQKCRFDAPFMPSKRTMILTPMKDSENEFARYKKKYCEIRKNLENTDYVDVDDFYAQNCIDGDQEYISIIRAGINSPKVILKRQPSEKWHNPFNPFLLNVVKSNTDFQFIPEEYSCAAFVLEYVNKTNRGVSNLQRRIIETMNEPKFDIVELTKRISVDVLNLTEITSQEAAWYLLKEPMSKTSTVIVYIPTVWPMDRQRIKKTMKELSDLEDDCTDIWKENWFDKYEKRPDYLEEASLAQFVSKYYKNNKGEYVLRSEPQIIRYRNYDMADDFNEYRREMVTLHIPFRDEETEILSEMKFIQIYEGNEGRILQSRKEFESDIDVAKTIQICREITPTDDDEIQDVPNMLPEVNPFEQMYDDPNSDMNDDLCIAMLNKLGPIAKKKKI